MVLLAQAEKTREHCLRVSNGEAELRASRREREGVEASCSSEAQRDMCSQKIRLSAHRKKCIRVENICRGQKGL